MRIVGEDTRHAPHCERRASTTTWVEFVRCAGCGAVSTTRRGREDMIEELQAENAALTAVVARVANLRDVWATVGKVPFDRSELQIQDYAAALGIVLDYST